MKKWSSRFDSKLDECIHLILALLLSDVYGIQKCELLDNYGEKTVEKAYSVVINDYKTLLERI